MSWGTKRPGILLATTMSVASCLIMVNSVHAADSASSTPESNGGSVPANVDNASATSNWTTSGSSSDSSNTSNSSTTSSPSPTTAPKATTGGASASKGADTAKVSHRKLPSAVEMLKRFQKGGNPNEIMSSDDADSAPGKDAAGKSINPTLAHNFGPTGAMIPKAVADNAAAVDSESTDEKMTVVVAKEPPVLPESPEVLAAVRESYGYLSKGKAAEALATMSAIVRKEPGSMLARRACAFVMLYNGSSRESIDQLFALATLPKYQPQSFDRCTLGDAYLQLGRPDNALIAYEDALKINPENVQAKSGELRSMALVGRMDEAITECVDAYKKAKLAPVQAYYRSLYIALAEAKAQLPGGQGYPTAGGNAATSNGEAPVLLNN